MLDANLISCYFEFFIISTCFLLILFYFNFINIIKVDCVLIKVSRLFSFYCAGLCIGLGAFYVLWWHLASGIDPATVGISYSSSIAYILIGAAIFSLYSHTRFPWTNFFGAILLLNTFAKIVYPEDFTLDTHIFFLHSNSLNLLSFFLLGSALLVWKRDNPTQVIYFYSFFTIFTSLGLTVIGLITFLFGYSTLYGNTHFWGMIAMVVSCAGFLSSLVHFELTRHANSYKWVPITLGSILFIFSMILSFGLYLSIKHGGRPELSDILISYAFIGGVVFSLFFALVVYFWLLGKVQLRRTEEAEKALKISQENELSALHGAEMGIWRWDVIKDEIYWTDWVYKLFGREPGSAIGGFQGLVQMVHPEDRDSFIRAVENTVQRHQLYEMEFRVVWPNKSIHFIHAKGNFSLDPEKKVSSMAGIVWDVTAKKYSEQLLKLSEGVAKILARAPSLQEAANELLTLFHVLFGWEILAIWKRKTIADPFACLVLEALPLLNAAQFIESSRTIHESKPDPFYENLVLNMQPIAIRDIGSEPEYFRSSLAVKEGIRGGLVFPILEGNSVTGIIELFKKDPYPLEIEPVLSAVLNSIGIGIGEFIRKKAAENAERELMKIVTSSQEAIYSCALDGTILSWNSSAERIFGWSTEEIIGKKIEVLFPSERLNEFEMLKKTFQELKDIFRMKAQRKTKEGKYLWMEITYSMLLDDQGNKSKVAIIAHDISEEKAAQAALAKSEEKYKIFVESTDEWIWEIDRKGILIYSNPAVQRTLGYEAQEVVGESIYLFMTDSSQEQFKQEMRECFLEKSGWKQRTLTCKNKQGKKVLFEIIAFPVLNDRNEMVGLRGAARDVTEKEMMEKSKNEFISMISHEIRTPLTSIHGALGLLSVQPDLSKKAQELIQLAYRNSNLLSSLIQDVVDIEKIEAGKIEFRLERVSLPKLIQDAVRSSTLISEKGDIKIIEELRFPDIEVQVDSDRLTQVLLNLLSNAVKFSPAGGTVYVSMEQIGGKVRVSVRDEGEGIPEEFQAKIFGRFEQAVSSVAKQKKGTGLGLSISKAIIEQMGGTIGFHSIFGHGATFYFELPIANKAAA